VKRFQVWSRSISRATPCVTTSCPYEEVIAEARQCTLNLQMQVEGGGGWQSVGSMDLEADEGRGWRAGLQEGAQQLRDLHVKANDPHYDAKLFPHIHPYGTGSLLHLR